MSQIKDLIKLITKFRDERDWKKAHTPKNSALSLIIEAGELIEHFQWRDGADLEKYIKKNKKEISYELADVLYWVLLICHDLDINASKALQEKLKINRKKYPVKWAGISGSWRNVTKKVEKEVRREVRKLIKEGKGIISGGALGVDSIALDEALKNNSKALGIKIIIPSKFETYAKHFLKRAKEKVITKKQAFGLIDQLEELKSRNPKALIEGKSKKLEREDYFKRNQKVVHYSDELLAFRVNKSRGTTDTIRKAKEKGIGVRVFEYEL